MSHNNQVAEALPIIRRIMEALPPGSRADMARLWSTLRNTLVAQEQEIGELHQRLRERGDGESLEPPTRPPSSASVQGLRAAIDDAMAAVDPNDSTQLLRVINTLPPQWLRDRLASDRDRTRDNELGCWVSGRSASHKGYVKVNLRNTLHPVTGQAIRVYPYLHQLAIVADGRGAHLHNAHHQVK